ncbi:hypothetical protein K474DRAFT_1663028 [Panus rudis PR-1116 ss-1]|nr:hypothetical protein K474DRAFT_1663028 [Panus rudis PR-1116 ss-1]
MAIGMQQTQSSSSTSSMHRCIQVDEILRVIIHFVSPSIPRTVGQLEARNKSFLSLALTCRTFRDPAIDALWETQYGIWNLVKHFPEDLYKVSTTEENHHVWTFEREPVEADWEGFSRYAKRVRNLLLNTFPSRTRDAHPSPEAYQTLLCHTAKFGPLLPTLRSIHWQDNRILYKTIEPFIPVFVGPSLEELAISSVRGYDDYIDRKFIFDLREALRTVPRLSPSLLSFGQWLFPHVWDTTCTVPEICRIISQMQKLTAYTSKESFTYQEYQSLSLLPNMQYIHGRVAIQDGVPARIDQVLHFRSLTTLILDDQFLIDDSRKLMFHNSRFPNLQKLALRWDDTFLLRPEHCGPLFRAILTSCSAENLRDIEISVCRTNRRDFHSSHTDKKPPTSHIDIDVISILFAFRNLERVVLTSQTTFCLDDNDMARISSAWPRLYELRLTELAIPHWDINVIKDDPDAEPTILTHHARPTLAGVVSFAQNCPRLVTLGMPFLPHIPRDSSSSSLPKLWHKTPRRMPSPPEAPLSTLMFPSYRVDDPIQVAEFLHRNLPNLMADEVDYCTMSPAAYEVLPFRNGTISPSWYQVTKVMNKLEAKDRERRKMVDLVKRSRLRISQLVQLHRRD